MEKDEIEKAQDTLKAYTEQNLSDGMREIQEILDRRKLTLQVTPPAVRLVFQS